MSFHSEGSKPTDVVFLYHIFRPFPEHPILIRIYILIFKAQKSTSDIDFEGQYFNVKNDHFGIKISSEISRFQKQEPSIFPSKTGEFCFLLRVKSCS